MQVVVVASRKGGAGKTTLASHLAVEAERQGAGPVVLVDTDPQGGLADWWNRRSVKNPMLIRPGPGQLVPALEQMRRGGTIGLVLIDTPPAITESIAATIQLADLVLVPARPSPNDLRAIPGTVALIEASGKRMCFVINAVKPRVRLTGDAAIVLSQHGTVAPVQVYDRTEYAAAMIDGRTAPETAPGGKAGAEMAELWTYLAARLARPAVA